MSAHQHLRLATSPDHEAVDAGFARFDLGEREGYTAFLTAHSRAVPAIEAVLTGAEGPPPLRPRTPLLAADLAALGHDMPPIGSAAAPKSPAEAWGMAYVLEGSRLGGGLLARSVGAGLPHAYLSDTHHSGEWRAFVQAMDAALVDEDAVRQATEAARGVFKLYAEAATGA